MIYLESIIRIGSFFIQIWSCYGSVPRPHGSWSQPGADNQRRVWIWQDRYKIDQFWAPKISIPQPDWNGCFCFSVHSEISKLIMDVIASLATKTRESDMINNRLITFGHILAGKPTLFKRQFNKLTTWMRYPIAADLWRTENIANDFLFFSFQHLGMPRRRRTTIPRGSGSTPTWPSIRTAKLLAPSLPHVRMIIRRVSNHFLPRCIKLNNLIIVLFYFHRPTGQGTAFAELIPQNQPVKMAFWCLMFILFHF